MRNEYLVLEDVASVTGSTNFLKRVGDWQLASSMSRESAAGYKDVGLCADASKLICHYFFYNTS